MKLVSQKGLSNSVSKVFYNGGNKTMNQWILPMAIVALVLAVGAFTFVNAQSDSASANAPVEKAGCGMAGCNGGCTAEKNCGSPSCGAANGGTCACGRAK